MTTDCKKCSVPLGKTDNLNLSILSAISGLLSVIGSSLIIFMILRRKGLGSMRNRLLFVMSIIDIISSISLGLFTIPIPDVDVWQRPTHGFGNAHTCSAQGFATQLGTAVPSYNAMLCVYYMALIKYTMEESTLAKKYELYMHAFAILPPLTIAILCVSMDLYGTGGRNCWLIHDANDVNNPRNILINVTTSLTVFAGMTILLTMTLVYCTVRKRENAVAQYSFPGSTPPRQSRSLTNTFHQALLFVAGFFMTYTWTGITLIMVVAGTLDEQNRSFVIVMYFQAVFLPLQGFWNFLAFARPSYVNIQRHNSNLSFLATVKKLILQRTRSSSRTSMGFTGGSRTSNRSGGRSNGLVSSVGTGAPVNSLGAPRPIAAAGGDGGTGNLISHLRSSSVPSTLSNLPPASGSENNSTSSNVSSRPRPPGMLSFSVTQSILDSSLHDMSDDGGTNDGTNTPPSNSNTILESTSLNCNDNDDNHDIDVEEGQRKEEGDGDAESDKNQKEVPIELFVEPSKSNASSAITPSSTASKDNFDESNDDDNKHNKSNHDDEYGDIEQALSKNVTFDLGEENDGDYDKCSNDDESDNKEIRKVRTFESLEEEEVFDIKRSRKRGRTSSQHGRRSSLHLDYSTHDSTMDKKRRIPRRRNSLF